MTANPVPPPPSPIRPLITKEKWQGDGLVSTRTLKTRSLHAGDDTADDLILFNFPTATVHDPAFAGSLPQYQTATPEPGPLSLVAGALVSALAVVKRRSRRTV